MPKKGCMETKGGVWRENEGVEGIGGAVREVEVWREKEGVERKERV